MLTASGGLVHGAPAVARASEPPLPYRPTHVAGAARIRDTP